MMDRLLSGLRVFIPVSAVALIAVACTSTATVGPADDGTACEADAAVSCSQGSGYSCGAGVPSPAGLDCSDPTPDGDLDTYCCFDFTSTTCSQDDSVAGCVAGSFGFSCTSTDTPDTADSTLVCSTGTADGSDTLYCCTDGTTTTSTACTADTTVSCSQGNGYSCGAGVTPDASSLECSDPTPDGDLDTFCCFDFSSTTCSQDDSVAGCVAGSYGFSCTGTDSPDSTDSSLVCSTGTADGSDTLYCCTQ